MAYLTSALLLILSACTALVAAWGDSIGAWYTNVTYLIAFVLLSVGLITWSIEIERG